MAYALIKDGAVVAYPYTLGDFSKQNPNVSLPATPTVKQLEEVGMYLVVPTAQPQYNALTQNCAEGTPVLEALEWRQVWVVSPATPSEILDRETSAKAANKQQASNLLAQTDWTTIPDVSDPNKSMPYLANSQEFVVYRNQVRQIAITPPVTVDVWPTAPQEVWASTPPVAPTQEVIVDPTTTEVPAV